MSKREAAGAKDEQAAKKVRGDTAALAATLGGDDDASARVSAAEALGVLGEAVGAEVAQVQSADAQLRAAQVAAQLPRKLPLSCEPRKLRSTAAR